MFLETPERFYPLEGANDTKCLRLKQNSCGSCFGPALWHDEVKKGLKNGDFESSAPDPCLFLSTNTTIVAHVDDVVFCSKSKKKTNAIIQSFINDGGCCK